MRIFNAIVAGLIAGLLLYLLVSLATVKAAFLVFLAGWAISTFFFYNNAASLHKIWARACLLLALECLAIPIASWILPFFYGHQAVQSAMQGAQSTGQTVGSIIGGGVVNMLAGYAGLAIGFVLLATAYLSLKPARRRH
ncbi:MAG: hypothetical protein PHT62_02795 [Desulfotomaculaceae bacterium]|nr:hypothetical protein [Desulfotomaculaceae bacterium]